MPGFYLYVNGGAYVNDKSENVSVANSHGDLQMRLRTHKLTQNGNQMRVPFRTRRALQSD